MDFFSLKETGSIDRIPALSMLALGVSSLFLAPRPAAAFTLEFSGQNVDSGWPSSSISVDTDPSCSGISAVQAALSAAVGIWSNLPTSDLTVSVGTTRALGSAITTFAGTGATQQYVGGTLIYCDTNFDSDFGYTAPSDIPGLELAPTLSCATGQTYCPIQGGLIVLNADNGDLSNATLLDPTILSVVVAHELGHALGLGHSSDVNALMYFDATQKKALALAQDDVNGISYLYSRNELGGSKMFGCGTVAAIGSGKRGRRAPRDDNPSGGSAEFAILICALASVRLLTRLLSRA